MASIRARAKHANGITTVRILLSHPMETGRRKNKATGKTIPAHYITELSASLGEEKLIEADLGPGISANPLYSFKFKGGASGDTLKIHWVDNKGNSDEREISIR